MTTRTDYRDAVGWLYAALRQDWEGRYELARMCNPPGLVAALTDMLLGLAAISTNGRPLTYLDYMRDNLDVMLDRYEMEDE